MAALLKLSDVSKRYDSPAGDGGGVPILDHISLELAAGESLAVMGPSGSGKSTLLQIIGTLDRPSSGEVFLNGRDLNKLHDQDLARDILKTEGFAFTESKLVVVEVNPSELKNLMTALLEAELNIHYLYPFIPQPHGKPVVGLNVEDNDLAEEALGRHQFKTLRQPDISR